MVHHTRLAAFRLTFVVSVFICHALKRLSLSIVQGIDCRLTPRSRRIQLQRLISEL